MFYSIDDECWWEQLQEPMSEHVRRHKREETARHLDVNSMLNSSHGSGNFWRELDSLDTSSTSGRDPSAMNIGASMCLIFVFVLYVEFVSLV